MTSLAEYFLSRKLFKRSLECCPAYISAVFLTHSRLWHFLCSAGWPQNTCKQDFGGTTSNHSLKIPFPCFVGHKISPFFFPPRETAAKKPIERFTEMFKCRKEQKNPSRIKFKPNPTNCVWYSTACCSQLLSEVNKTFCWIQGLPAQEWAPRRDDAQRRASASLLASEMGDRVAAAHCWSSLLMCVWQVTNSKQKVA